MDILNIYRWAKKYVNWAVTSYTYSKLTYVVISRHNFEFHFGPVAKRSRPAARSPSAGNGPSPALTPTMAGATPKESDEEDTKYPIKIVVNYTYGKTICLAISMHNCELQDTNNTMQKEGSKMGRATPSRAPCVPRGRPQRGRGRRPMSTMRSHWHTLSAGPHFRIRLCYCMIGYTFHIRLSDIDS